MAGISMLAARSLETVRVAKPDKNLRWKMWKPETMADRYTPSETSPGRSESPWPVTATLKARPSADSSNWLSGDTRLRPWCATAHCCTTHAEESFFASALVPWHIELA